MSPVRVGKDADPDELSASEVDDLRREAERMVRVASHGRSANQPMNDCGSSAVAGVQ